MANWRDYFEFNKRERNGTLLLAFILVGMLGVMQFSRFASASDPMDFREFEDQIDAFQAQQNDREAAEESKSNSYQTSSNSSQAKPAPTYFNFDPNNLPIDKWQALGLSAKQAQSIHNYEAKGGKFRKKEDLLKMYVVDQKLYDKWEPYIRIATDEKTNSSYKETTSYPETKRESSVHFVRPDVSITINTADTLELVALKGIGPSYARRIVKYRNMLGGFVSKEQLLEVYGMDQERYEGFVGNIIIDVDVVEQINVNTCTAEELQKHPYIRWNLANAIVNYRHLHGPYAVLEDIQQSHLVTADIYAKIAPYLIVQ